MGFFLPALFVGGLGMTQHLASRELDDIVRQAEQPVFGFWWGFSLGALTGLWIGCNFGPLLVKIKHVVSSVGGWMFLSSPPPLHAGIGSHTADIPSADAGAAVPPAAGYGYMHTADYAPFVHSDHLHPQQQHQHMRSSSRDIRGAGGSVLNRSDNINSGAGTGRRGSSDGRVLPPCCSSESTQHLSPQHTDLLKHAVWTPPQPPPHTAHPARGTAYVSPLQKFDAKYPSHTEQTAKKSSSGTWW